jgi:hypothetical protein
MGRMGGMGNRSYSSYSSHDSHWPLSRSVENAEILEKMTMFKTLALAITVALTTVGCATSPTTKPVPAPAGPATAAPVATPPATTPHEVSASELVDHLGDSIETAVPVPIDAPSEGVDFQKHWIFDHFGRFREKKFAMGHAPGSAGQERHYDIITFELPDGSTHTVFFDMTDYWEHAPQKPKP